jgi:hypothetical protein
LAFIVVPKVRRKLPSAVKKVVITFLRSSRFGSVRYRLKLDDVSLTVRPSERVTEG